MKSQPMKESAVADISSVTMSTKVDYLIGCDFMSHSNMISVSTQKKLVAAI